MPARQLNLEDESHLYLKFGSHPQLFGCVMEIRSKLVATLPNGKNLNRQGREVRQGGIVFLNSSLFLLGVLGGENSPYGEGSCSPFAEDFEIRV